MQTDPDSDAEQSKQEKDDHTHIPYDGFVNVNDIIRRRRQLRNADFNVADETWDADFNPLPKQGHEESPE
ncbi:hypothetical protein SAMN06265348_110207 [Pedobacter westerhofensis]|uniref:Uncharacterized protein n=1 Tax=Pedobacter westerhofensis TaxID=425512 RepID=A0A521F7R8_9SPHI|nr:hypothetical protein [Pedobacter westerhofensis]SMO91580.1 hypothetical protein SAMN06265348_110207 [Pedobacter westerhofensis]